MKYIALTPWEKHIVQQAKLNFDSDIILQVKHMSHRMIELEDKSLEGKIWLFYMPDFTNVFKDWYRLYVRTIIKVYDTQASSRLQTTGDYVLLKYQGLRPRHIIAAKIENKDFNYIYDLLKRIDVAEHACNAQFRVLMTSAGNLRQDEFLKFIKILNYYAAFGLDTVFPEEMLKEKFPFVELGKVYYTPISSWGILRKGVIDCLESVYLTGDFTTAIKKYADEISYLRWGDIESRESDLRFSERMLVGARKEFSNITRIWEYQQEKRDACRLIGSPLLQYSRYLQEVSKKVTPSQLPLFNVLVDFASRAQEYNERRRILFTKGLRFIREVCERNGLDWRSISLDDVRRKLK